MKKISLGSITGIFLFFVSISAFPQNGNPVNTSHVEPYPLSITFEKTTNLIFPYTIISVDRGSQNVLAQKAKNVENILQIKAGKKGFDETNLTVITADGKFYSFLLNYAVSPSVLNLDFSVSKPSKPDAFLSPEIYNQKELVDCSKAAAVEKKKVWGIKDKKYGMGLRLNGLFIHDRVMYYRIKVVNQSNIGYDIGQVRFFICDRQKTKRTAVQEIEITPLYVHNDAQTVKGQSEHVFVFALSKFTIPDKKYLAIQLMEKNGGRHLELKVPGKALVRSTVLPTL
jgi:conjugative transposon TraN protein